jgi:hypothetical protein
MSLIIGRGERAVIIGSTGSGKTQMLLAQLKAYPDAPIYVMDTKGDAAIQMFMDKQAETKNVQIINSPAEIAKFAKQKAGPEYAHILPPASELAEPEILDGYLEAIYAAGRPCLVCIDEAYQVHNGHRAGPGLIGLLTRGRSKGMSLICCTQRPAWLSRFVFTESQRFFVYRLQDLRDYKTLREMGVPYPQNKSLAKFCFFCYNSGESDGTFYAPIPIEHDPGYSADDGPKTKFY